MTGKSVVSRVLGDEPKISEDKKSGCEWTSRHRYSSISEVYTTLKHRDLGPETPLINPGGHPRVMPQSKSCSTGTQGKRSPPNWGFEETSSFLPTPREQEGSKALLLSIESCTTPCYSLVVLWMVPTKGNVLQLEKMATLVYLGERERKGNHQSFSPHPLQGSWSLATGNRHLETEE